ncbi:hypothetical protein [Cellulomonas sp. Root137]|uniref:AMIN-like domain-containing (lipo)protein n=1 Tax=Cellulomonas sp. Root137 TaxID=1736459 RepID=UPI0006F3C20A|nr:hypothetical protein [Cellulomonas sp. Root137]KQY44116.1 hypothetical protein ASD18_17450 [Cellulomonas sp. Root137]
MKRRGVVAVVVLLVALLLTPAAPAAAAPYCGVRWGSLAKGTSAGSMTGDVGNVRTGRHTCYDRLVVDVVGPFAGYTVSYVDTVTGVDGRAVAVRGGARLQIDARAWTQTDAAWVPYFVSGFGGTVEDMRDVSRYRTFRQVSWAGTADGLSTIGLGVRARLPFRAFLLQGPGEGSSRLVVDVAHRW